MITFKFNNGESKRLDKPLANLLASRGEGTIEGHEGVKAELVQKSVTPAIENVVKKQRAKRSR